MKVTKSIDVVGQSAAAVCSWAAFKFVKLLFHPNDQR